MMLTCVLAAKLLILLSTASAKVKTSPDALRYFKDDEFKEMKSVTDGRFAVFFHSNEEANVKNAIKAINSSVGDLREYDMDLGLINCTHSSVGPCQKSENLNHMLVYKNSEIVGSIGSEDLQTPLQAVAYLKHYLLLENLIELHDSKDYEEVQKLFAGRADVFVFYVPSLGTQEHLTMIDRSTDVPHDVALCLTTNKELCHNGDIAWYLSCSQTAEGDTCPTKFATSDLWSPEIFRNKITQSSAVTVFTSGVFANTMRSAVNTGSDVLLLIAGTGKFKEALVIAKVFVTKLGDTVQCVVVNSQWLDTNDNYLSPRIEDGKIFVAASPGKLGQHALVDVGFMQKETVEEAVEAFHHALSTSYAQQKRLEPDDSQDKEDDGTGFATSPVEVQDDPVVFSVHSTQHVRNLYYFDYKTIPRLTDETYVEVTESDNYAVIMFTLEFNSRALAALVNYVEIHKMFKERGVSPLYRVECYNWPDVCDKAGVYTYPRMFFYPAGNQDKVEYDGLWDKNSMAKAIIRYRIPTVIVVREQEDILDYLPLNGRFVVGLFETDEGTDIFNEAAELLRRDYVFVEIHDETAMFMTKQYQAHFEHRGLLAFDMGFPVGEQSRFETKHDILDFIEGVFAPSLFEELTIHNFAEVIKSPNPLVIYFRVDDDAPALMLNQTLQVLSPDEKYAGKVLFSWMDATSDTTGEFVLQTYNRESRLQDPIAAFFDKKGSVMLRSCFTKKCDEYALENWIDECIEGKVEPTYSLSHEEWKPRLAGYDFLEMMRSDGLYPEEKASRSVQDDDEGSVMSSGKGRRIATMHEKPKKEKRSTEKVNEQEKMMSADGMKPGHTEL